MDITELLKLIVEKGASDLHLKVPSVPVLRIDGELIPQTDYPKITPEWIKETMSTIVTKEQLNEFQENMELDFSYSIPGVSRFRVNASRQRGTITLALRLIKWEIPVIESLGLPEICKELVTLPNGLVLVTGPTGSGKSTTLASMVEYLNMDQRRRVITIEDPIEYLFNDQKCTITQRELGTDTLSFSSAIIHALRQDPDVILVGEMRDLATINTAITAAETGHLVLSTLHTSSASQAVDRIIDVFSPEEQQQIRLQLSNVLMGVIYQSLLHKSDGAGRIPAVEVMIATSAVRNQIREGKTHQIMSTIQTGASFGMQTLNQSLANLVKENLVSVEDAMAKSNDPKELDDFLGAQ